VGAVALARALLLAWGLAPAARAAGLRVVPVAPPPVALAHVVPVVPVRAARVPLAGAGRRRLRTLVLMAGLSGRRPPVARCGVGSGGRRGGCGGRWPGA
jgi:hypothetical protein